MKIILLTPLLQPYRISFYEKLYALFPGLIIYHNTKLKEDGRPGYNQKVSFPAKGFREINFNIANFVIIWLKGMFSQVKMDKPDLIISQGIPGNFTYSLIVNWAKRNKIKVVFWYCGWEPNKKRSNLLLAIKRLIARNHYKKGDFFLTYSVKAKNELIRAGHSPEKIIVAYNGIELDDYLAPNKYYEDGIKLKQELNPSGKLVYLFVGGLLKEKRVLFLIDVFEKFHSLNTNVELWIIGDGPQRKAVEEKTQKHTFVKYFGRIIDGVEPYFVAADFFVLPGTGGLALNQAMFFETPCICTKADGTEDDLVIDGVTGFRFEEDNPDSLLVKLKESSGISDDNLSLMKIRGKEIIVNMSNVNSMIKTFESTIKTLFP